MRTARRHLLLWPLMLSLMALATPPAGAAGPPLPSGYSGRHGVALPGGGERIVARRAGAGTLLIAGARTHRLAGRWSIAAVTVSGGTTGLSADGRTLVLVRPQRDFPPMSTHLAIIDARSFKLRRTIHLNGFFTLDAVAPDGGTAYLLQYPTQDFLDYRVRALDTATGGFAAHDIVDPREPDEQMGGLPYRRTTGPGGRWVYTLYGGGTETFIHALDTVGKTAACIDLEMLPDDGDLSRVQLQLNADASRLRVRKAGSVVAIVDTRTFAVREPGQEAAAAEPAASPAPAPARADVGGGGLLLPLAVGGALLLLAAAALARRPWLDSR
jgi:hypothetical protein